jgi:endoglucanase
MRFCAGDGAEEVDGGCPGDTRARGRGRAWGRSSSWPACSLVDHLRDLGSTNVLITDAARLGERSAGLPLLDDPLDRLAYAVHPYYYVLGTSWWDEQYGDLATVAPVLATEWNHLAAECGTAAERLAPDLLDYLARHGIGVFGHDFDIPGTTVADWSWTPTDCGTANGGSGALLRDHFGAGTPR